MQLSPRTIANLDRFPPQYKERLRPLSKKPGKFMDQDMLDLVRLLYPYADSDTVDTWLDEDFLILITCNRQWIQEDLG